MTVSIPYIQGDEEALLQARLVEELSSTGIFTCVQNGGNYSLAVKFLSEELERIGFRYDRDNPSGRKEKNLLGVESRRKATIEVSLLDAATQKTVVGPFLVRANVDFDYTDPGSPRDLLFANRMPTMQFSLGQLDSSEGAFDDSMRPLTRKLAQEAAQILQEKMR